MNFEFPEDKKYFIDLLAVGNTELFNQQFIQLFDFRDPQVKRAEFKKIRNKVFDQLIVEKEKKCQLRLIEECEKDKHLVVDHYIPLSTNELNKKLRNLRPEPGKKVKSQSFGSNHKDNFILACERCNGFKKHRLIKIENKNNELLDSVD